MYAPTSMASVDTLLCLPCDTGISLRTVANRSGIVKRGRSKTSPAKLGTLPVRKAPPTPQLSQSIVISNSKPRQEAPPVYFALSPLKPKRAPPPVPKPPSVTGLFTLERYQNLPLPPVPSPPSQNLINLPVQALSSGGLATILAASSELPLSKSQNLRGTLRSMAKTREWAMQCGVRSDKRLRRCMKGEAGSACWCESRDKLRDFSTSADRIMCQVRNEGLYEISLSQCVAEEFLFYILTRFPRLKIEYVHIDSGVECVDVDCQRTHLLKFLCRLHDTTHE